MDRKSFIKSLPALLLLAAYLAAPTTAWAGYTHYWTWKETPNKDSLKQCIKEMKQLVESRRTLLAGPDGEGKPILKSDQIEFNGVGENAHEPFIFPREKGFNFCKTQWKPYNEVVVACLFVARDHFSPSQLEIASDGQVEPDAFQDGRQLYAETFSRQPKDLFGSSDVRSDKEDGNGTPLHTEATSRQSGDVGSNAETRNRISRWLTAAVFAVAVVILVWWFRRR
jgi:hypothetical protein